MKQGNEKVPNLSERPAKLSMKLAAWHSSDNDPEPCPIRDIMNRIGDKWTMRTLITLSGGKLRYSELLRSFDISKRMLTATLRHLERDGFVGRQVFPTNPPSVEYSITELGKAFIEAFDDLVLWSEKSQSALREARTRFDKQARQVPASKRLRRGGPRTLPKIS